MGSEYGEGERCGAKKEEGNKNERREGVALMLRVISKPMLLGSPYTSTSDPVTHTETHTENKFSIRQRFIKKAINDKAREQGVLIPFTILNTGEREACS